MTLKNYILIGLILLAVSSFSSVCLASDCYPKYSLRHEQEESKITPIKAIILLCETGNAIECSDVPLMSEINRSPIKFLFRSDLKSILSEKSLQLSGLTEIESNKNIGKLLGASHLLFYKLHELDTGKGYPLIMYEFKLININTSEVELMKTTIDGLQRSFNDKRVENRFDKRGTIECFFETLNRHSSKLEKERRQLEEKEKQFGIVGKRAFLSAANEIKRDGRFIAYDNGTVLDTSTNLMWAAKDNGEDINCKAPRAIVRLIAEEGTRTGVCLRRMNWPDCMMRLKLISLNVVMLSI